MPNMPFIAFPPCGSGIYCVLSLVVQSSPFSSLSPEATASQDAPALGENRFSGGLMHLGCTGHVEGRVSSSPRPGLALLRGHSSTPQTLASWSIFLFSELPSPLQPGPNTQPSSGLTRLTHLSPPAEQALFLTYPLCGSQHRHERPGAEKM